MLNYEDNDFIRGVCSTIVIRVDRINEVFGEVATFCEKFNLHGLTNGKLLVISFMTSISDTIYDLENNIFLPANFKYKEDYLYFDEYLYYGVKYAISEHAYQELPFTKGLNWIKSILLKSGNYIWFTDSQIPLSEQEKELCVIAYFYHFHPNINQIHPIFIKEDEIFLYYKVSFSEEIQKIPKEIIFPTTINHYATK